ncbi:hypothetical protein N9Y60_05835, partial [Crocinitomicaceae bacterium]|nr:hypothetical protein [Crocinitomicaceae bacterium]
PISEVLWRQMEKSNMEDQVFQATNLEGIGHYKCLKSIPKSCQKVGTLIQCQNENGGNEDTSE